MDLSPPNFFAGLYVDRRSEVREEPDWLEAARTDPTTLYLIAQGTEHLIYLDPQTRISFIKGDHPLLQGVDARHFVLLGWFHGVRCVLVELPADTAVLPEGSRFEELRGLAPRLPPEEAGLLAYARALTIWRSRHRYCGVCGASFLPERAGHVLRCSNAACAQESFPRIDPAIIVLVSDGERALLGRQSSWPAGRYSTIAGFVEPGESLEDAVVREVFEETGVTVSEARYHSSQPWPFPASLMLGFYASSQPGSIIRVGGELEDVRWFTRAEIAGGAAGMPPSHSISYLLIRSWLAGAVPAG